LALYQEVVPSLLVISNVTPVSLRRSRGLMIRH
jgi:hypothetical protein